MEQQLQRVASIAAQGARTSDTLPQPPNEVSQAEADILNSSEVREELSEFARKNDREGFNQYIQDLSGIQAEGVAATLTPEAARAVIEADDYYNMYREHVREHDQRAEDGKLQHLDQETQEFLQEAAPELNSYIIEGDYQGYLTQLRSLAAGGFEGRQLTDEQLRAVENSDFFERMRSIYLRLRSHDLESQIFNARMQGNEQEMRRFMDDYGETIQELVDLGEEINGRPATEARIAALGFANARKQHEVNNDNPITQQEAAYLEQGWIRQSVGEMGFDLADVDLAFTEDLGMPEDLLASSMNEFDSVDEEDIVNMSMDEVLRLVLLYRRIQYLQEQEKQRERRRDRRTPRRSSPEQEEERAQTNRLLQERVSELAGDETDEILERIEDGRIRLPEVAPSRDPLRAHLTNDIISDGAVPIRRGQYGIEEQGTEGDSILARYRR
jgi:hypothetical protein